MGGWLHWAGRYEKNEGGEVVLRSEENSCL